MIARVAVFLVYSDPITGFWCDGCMSSARVRWPVHALTRTGVAGDENSYAERCVTCDPREGDDDAE